MTDCYLQPYINVLISCFYVFLSSVVRLAKKAALVHDGNAFPFENTFLLYKSFSYSKCSNPFRRKKYQEKYQK